MAGFDPNDYFKQKALESVSTTDPTQTINDIGFRLMQKKADLQEATARKLQALQDAHAAYEASQTLTGKVATLGTDNEYLRQLSKGAAQGTGLAIEGLGMALGAEDSLDGSTLKGFAQEIDKGVDTTFRANMENAMPEGDILDYSTWNMGKDFNIEGFMGNVANVFGQMAPIIGAGLLPGGAGIAGAGIAGSLQAGASGAEDAREYMNSLSDADLFEQVPLFKQEYAKAQGTEEEKLATARQRVTEEAEKTQSIVGGLIGGVGGALTGKLLNPLTGKLSKGLKSRAAGAALTSAEEGTQEVLESSLGRYAVNENLGTDRNTTEDTLADAVLGAAAGAGTTAIREARSLATGQTKKEIEAEKFADNFKIVEEARESGDVLKAFEDDKADPFYMVGKLIEEKVTPENVETKTQELTKVRDHLISKKKELSAAVAIRQEKLTEQSVTEEITYLKGIEEKFLAKEQTPEIENTLLEVREEIEKYEGYKDLIKSGKYNDQATFAKEFRKYKKSGELLEEVNEALSTINSIKKEDTAPKIKDTIAKATDEAVPVEERAKAAEEGILLMMRNPEAVTEYEIDGLISAPNVTSAQKNWLRSLKESYIARNKANGYDGVKKDIFERTSINSFKSLPDYTRDVRTSLESSDFTSAGNEISRLRRWSTSHASKAAAVTKAFEQANSVGTDQAVQVMPDKSQGTLKWTILSGKNRVSNKEVTDAGGLTISKKTPRRLIDSIKSEADAINSTLSMLSNEVEVHREAATRTTATPQVTQDTVPVQENVPVDANVDADSINAGLEDGNINTGLEGERATSDSVQIEGTQTNNPQEVAKPQEQTNTSAESTVSNEQSTVESEAPLTTSDSESVTNTSQEVTENIDEEVEVETEANPARVEGHLLNVIREKTDLIKAYFNRKKGHVSTNVDFLNKFVSSPLESSRVQSLLSEDTKVQANQTRALNALASFMKKEQANIISGFRPTFKLDANKKETSEINKYFQITQSFIDPNTKQLTPEVANAIAGGLFEVLINKATDPTMQTRDKVLDTFGADMQYDHPDFNDTVYQLRIGGTAQTEVVKELGIAITNFLGLRAHKKAPNQLNEKLINELGTYALNYAFASGYLKSKSIDGKILKKTGLDKLAPKYKDGTDNASEADGQKKSKKSENDKLILVSLRREWVTKDGKSLLENQSRVKAMVNSVRGAKGITGKLFEVESARKWPSETAPEIAPFKASRSIMNLPKKIRKAIEKAQKHATYVRKDMADRDNGILFQMPEEVVQFLIGIRSDTDVIGPLKDSIIGKNAGLLNDWENLKDFAESWNSDSPIFFEREVWSNQRVGLASNVLNPLQSKVHRFTVFNEGGEYVIKAAPKTKAEKKAYDDFRIAVLEGIGVKTDKQINEISLKQWNSRINDPVFAAGIAALEDLALKQSTGQVLNNVDYEAIKAAVDKGGEDLHSFDALWQLAQYNVAKRQGKDFTATLVREADGVNNGPMFSLLQTGVLNLEEFKGWNLKGGFFFKDDIKKFSNSRRKGQYQDFAENWQTQDLYETFASKVDDVLKGHRIDPLLNRLMGDLTDSGRVTSNGRKLFKDPVTQITYGSSEKKAVASIGNALLDRWYDEIQTLYVDYAYGRRPKQEILKDYNNALQEFKRVTGEDAFGGNVSINDLARTVRDIDDDLKLDYVKLTPKAEAAFLRAFNNSLGRPIIDVIERTFKPFTELRDGVTQLTGAMSKVLNLVLDQRVQNILDSKIANGEIAVGEKDNAHDDILTSEYQALYKELMKYAPAIATAASKGASIQTGLLATPLTRRKAAEDDALYTGSVAINFENITWGTDTKGEARKKKNATYVGSRPAFADPKVRAFVTNIHSSDSNVALSVYQDYNVLNVHDAAIAIPAMLAEVMTKYNEATFDTMLNHSVLEEVMLTSMRVMTNAQKLDTTNNPAMVKAIKGLDSAIRKHFPAFETADRNRLDFLSKVERIHQYAYEDAYFDLTEEHKQQIEAAKKKPFRTRIYNRLVSEGTIPNAAPVEYFNTASAQARKAATAEDLSPELKADIENDIKLFGKLRSAYVRTGNVDTAFAQVVDKYAAIESKEGATSEEIEASKATLQRLRELYRSFTSKMFSWSPAYVNTAEIVTPYQLRKLMNYALRMNMVPRYMQEDYAALQDFLATIDEPYRNKQTMLKVIEEVVGKNPNPIYELLNRQIATSFDPLIRGSHTNYNIDTLASDNILKDVVEANPTTTFGKLLPELNKAVSRMQDSPTKRHYKTLLKMVAGKLPKDFRIEYMSADRAADTNLFNLEKGLQGYYWTGGEGKGEHITIASPEISGLPIKLEIFMHELVHAVTKKAIDSKNPAVMPAVTNLETLYAKAKDYIRNNPELGSTFSYQMSDMDEFLTYGMTSPEFQERVLANIEVDSSMFFEETGGLKAVFNGVRAFINQIAYILTGGKLGKSTIDGVQAVMINVAAIIDVGNQRPLVSENEGALLRMASGTVNSFTELSSSETLSALAQQEGLDQDKAENLQEVLSTLVTNVHGSMGNIIDRLRNQGKANPAEAFKQAILSGEMPLYKGINSSGLVMDQASQYVAEQVDLSVRAALDTGSLAYQGIEKLFNEAKKKVSPKDFVADWDNAPQHEREKAKRIYRVIFSPLANGVERQSGLLAQFTALALTYDPLKKALDYTPRLTTDTSDMKLGERIKQWYNDLMRRFANFIHGNSANFSASKQLESLATSLVRREQLRQQKLEAKDSPVSKLIDKAELQGKKLVESGIQWAQESNKQTLRVLGNLADTYHDGKLDALVEEFSKFRQSRLKKLDGSITEFLGKLTTEVRGDNPFTRFGFDLLNANKLIQQRRQQTIVAVKDSVKDITGEATPEQERALTRTLIRTDLRSLKQSMSTADILALLKDRKALNAAILAHEQSLKANVKGDYYYRNAAYALGHFLATDQSRSPLLALNANNIATKAGTGKKVDIELSHRIEPIIDRLATLYALKHMDSVNLNNTVEFFESNANPEEALENLMLLHTDLVKSSKQTLFAGQATKLQKGYIKELYDPYVSVVAAPLADQAELEKQGYIFKRAILDIDGLHNQDMGLYYSDTGGLAQYNTGALSLTGTRSKGTSVFLSKQDGSFQRVLKKAQQEEAVSLSDINYIYNFNRLDTGRMVPVYDSKGEVVKFRYLMDADTKDSLLARDTAISNVMGAIAGSILDKPESKTHNKTAIAALAKDWKENRDAKRSMYVRVGLDSPDAANRERYATLPETTKQAILNQFGEPAMYVRSDMLDLIFGYRDVRLSDDLKVDPAVLKPARRLVAQLLTHVFGLFGDNVIHNVDRFQDSWEYIVKNVKNVYVIRNLNTLVGNVISNVSLLFLSGVPLKTMLREHRVAAEGLIRYQTEIRELNSLKVKLASGILSGMDNEVAERIADLELSLNNNPVKALIDAGQFPTILEDLDEDNSVYGFKPFLDKKLDEFTAKLPEPVVTVGKTLFVAEGTPVYKMLYKTTQMSDFVAKYVLYKHLKSEGVEEDSAQRTIRETFINYDAPSGKELHFMNKVGLLMFTRYFLRIQKVLARLFTEQTARSIMLVVADRFLGGVPSVNDSWALARLGNNPLESGALEALDAWNEPIIFKTLLGILD